MAAITEIKRKRGGVAYQVEFRLDGRRRWLSLGSLYDRDDVEEIARHVERIVRAIITGRDVDQRTRVWLEACPDDLRRRLERAELVTVEHVPTVREVFDTYEDELKDVTEGTLYNKRRAWARFFEVVDPTTPIDRVTRRDALAFLAALNPRYKEATRAAFVKDLKSAFKWAQREGIISRNPWDGVAGGSFKNKAREVYVSKEDYFKLVDACPSQMWRALLALYRIGGLRKAEAFELTWDDVDFIARRVLVHSPKTAKKGRATRVIPLFPELAEELEELWNMTPEGSPAHVITIRPQTLPREFEKIIFQAGLTPWARMFQNLRSSRAIEISREFGALAESEWIGHTEKTARDHYLHVLDDDYKAAAGLTKTTGETTGTTPANTRGGRPVHYI